MVEEEAEVDVVLHLPVEQQMHLHVLVVENPVAWSHTDKESILIQFHIFHQQNAMTIIVYRLNPARQLKVNAIFLA